MGAAFSAPIAAFVEPYKNQTDSYKNGLSRFGDFANMQMASKKDIWGNVRMPYLEKLIGYDFDNPYAWVDVTAHNLDLSVPYESLIGVPIRGLPDFTVGNATFLMSAAYTTFQVSLIAKEQMTAI